MRKIVILFATFLTLAGSAFAADDNVIQWFFGTSTAHMTALYTNGDATATYPYDSLETGDIYVVRDPSGFTMDFYTYDSDSAETEDEDRYFTPNYSANGIAYTGDARWCRLTIKAHMVIGTNVLAPDGDGSSLTGLTWSQIGSTPTTLAAIAALENGSGVLTNDGSGGLSWVAGGGSVTTSSPIGNTAFTDLAAGDTYTNFGDADDDTINELFEAIDESWPAGSDFDPASPGEIGGTTPNTGAFTTITVDEIAISKKSGEPSYYLLYEAETVSTMGVGAIGPDNVASTYYVKEPDALPAGSIAVYGTPAEESVPNLGTVAVSDKAWLDVTTSIDEESTNTEIPTAAAVESRIDSKIAGIEIPEGSGLPEGGTEGQIIIKGAESAGWGNGDDVAISYSPTDEYTNTDSTLAGHLAGIAAELAALKLQITTMTEAFNALGLNVFFFDFTSPADSPYYTSTTTGIPVVVDVTCSNTTYEIAGVRYQVDSGGYEGNSLVNTDGDTWEASMTEMDQEGEYTYQLEAVDTKGEPNTGESVVRTVIIDTTPPVIDLGAGANPTTHDGTGNGSYILDWAEMVTESNPASACWRIIDGETPGSWTAWASPWADVEVEFPLTEEDIIIELEVTDLAGNTGSDSVVVGYSGGGECAGTVVCQNFETPTTGYDNGETWEAHNAAYVSSADPIYSSSPLRGNQSLRIVAGESAPIGGRRISFDAMSECYVAFRMRIDSNSTDNVNILEFHDADGNRIANVAWVSGLMRIYGDHGAQAGSSTTNLSTATMYYVWAEYIKGTGSNGVLRIYGSTSRTKPGTPLVNITAGTATADCSRVVVGGGKSIDIIFDQIMIRDEAMGDMPE